jgi:hypothetical protein
MTSGYGLTAPIDVQITPKGRSAYGLFAQSAEAEVVARIMQDLSAEGMEHVLTEYLRVVPDPDRQARAEATLSTLQAQGSRSTLGPLIEVLYFAGYQHLLRKYNLRFPAYNILEDFFAGSQSPPGPRSPSRPVAASRSWFFLGRPIGFPIGVPASVLTSNNEWTHYFAQHGYNVITARTVRSRAWAANPVPNWVFVPRIVEPLKIGAAAAGVIADPHDWVDAGSVNVTTSNSFGVPSHSPEQWQPDLVEAKRLLHADQMLIASVLGEVYESTGDSEHDARSLAEDFVRTALLAEDCGVDAIELNVSCPNSLIPGGGVKPPLCMSAEVTSNVVAAVRAALRPGTHLLVKLAYMPKSELTTLVSAIAPHVSAISGINTLVLPIQQEDGQETFPGRPRAGVSGIAVRDHALQFVRDLAEIRLNLEVNFDIIGMGGVTDPASFLALYEAGASVVQSASGVFANPFLAQDCFDAYADDLPQIPPTPALADAIQQRVLQILRVAPEPLTKYDVAASVATFASSTYAAVGQLLEQGLITESRSGGLRAARS